MTSKVETTGIPEDRVARILARAAELDRIAPTVQPEIIRAAAIEAGISAAAVERALDEFAAAGEAVAVAAPPVPDTPTKPRFWRRWAAQLRYPVALGALSFLLGTLAVDVPAMLVVGFALMVGVPVRMAWRAQAIREVGQFQLTTFLMALGLGFGFGLPGGDEDAAALIIFAALALLVSGTVAIYVRNHDRTSEREVTASAAT